MSALTKKSRSSHAMGHGKPARAKSGKDTAPSKQDVKALVAASEKMAEKIKTKGYMPAFV